MCIGKSEIKSLFNDDRLLERKADHNEGRLKRLYKQKINYF